MCFNEKVSLSTWVTGMAGSAVLYKLDKLPEAIFYGTVIQMQLVEYFLWKNQPEDNISTISTKCTKCQLPKTNLCNNTNKTVTKVGTVINHMEPIMLFSGILLFSKKQLPISIIIFMILFIVVSIGYTSFIFNNANDNESMGCSIVTDDSSPHLNWQWNHNEYNNIYYIIFLITLIILSIFGLEDGKFNAIITFISYLISYNIYNDTKSTGAMWCFMAAFAPWLIILRTLYLKH